MREIISFMRGMHGEVRAFFWLSRAFSFCFQGIYLIGFNLYLLRLGYDEGFTGMASGIAILALAIGSFAMGRTSVAPRTTATIGGAMGIVAFTMLGVTDLLPEEMRTAWVLSGDALGGFGGAVFTVGRSAYLMSITTADNRMAAFALDQVGGAVAALCGGLVMTFVPAAFASALGTTLDDPAPFRFAILVAPLALIFAVLWFSRTGTPRPHEAAGSADPSPPREAGAAEAGAAEAGAAEDSAAETGESTRQALTLITVMTVVALLFSLGDAPLQFLFNVYMDKELGAPPTMTTATMAISRLITIIPILALPMLSRRWSTLTITVAIASLLAFATVPLALIQHEIVAAASFLVYSLFRGAFDPAFEVLRMSLVPKRWYMRMAGRVGATIAFSMGMGAGLGGLIGGKLGYIPLFLGSCALIVSSVLVLLSRRGSITGARIT